MLSYKAAQKMWDGLQRVSVAGMNKVKYCCIAGFILDSCITNVIYALIRREHRMHFPVDISQPMCGECTDGVLQLMNPTNGSFIGLSNQKLNLVPS